MEFNPLGGIEKSDQIAWNSDDRQVSGHVRSFTCTFCKRGFSNAQALGGHMNIHRKDRAKLKESSSDQSLLSVDTTKKTPSDHLHSSAEDDDSKLESSEEKSCIPKSPWIFSKEDDAVSRGKDGAGELQQLDLFVETPSSSNDQSSSQGNEDVEKSKQLSHGLLQEEVDLELRLGSEHH